MSLVFLSSPPGVPLLYAPCGGPRCDSKAATTPRFALYVVCNMGDAAHDLRHWPCATTPRFALLSPSCHTCSLSSLCPPLPQTLSIDFLATTRGRPPPPACRPPPAAHRPPPTARDRRPPCAAGQLELGHLVAAGGYSRSQSFQTCVRHHGASSIHCSHYQHTHMHIHTCSERERLALFLSLSVSLFLSLSHARPHDRTTARAYTCRCTLHV